MEAILVAEGLGFPEGPVVLPDGSLLVVEIRHGQVTRIAPDGTKQVVARVGGGPNGAALAPAGALIICNHGGSAWPGIDGLGVPVGPSADSAGVSLPRPAIGSGGVGKRDVESDREGTGWGVRD